MKFDVTLASFVNMAVHIQKKRTLTNTTYDQNSTQDYYFLKVNIDEPSGFAVNFVSLSSGTSRLEF